ncbi:MAG: signal peptidase I [Actinomycetota bacterium]
MRWFVKDLLIPVAVAVALALVIQGSIAKPYEIPTESMFPTIKANDRIIANRLIYRFRDISRGDVVVFDPTDPAKAICGDAVSDVPFVKRVIGLPGDRIEVRDGQTLVNGRPFVVENADRPEYSTSFPQVPDGKVLVLGDNRNQSCDSHQWPDPFVPIDNVIGQAELTYWPLSHLKFL